MALVVGLASTGVLKTAETGDITYVDAVNTGDGRVSLDENSQLFVIESPTDVDVFYNIAIYYRNGGSLYAGNSHDPFVQLKYNYAPVVFPIFYSLSFLGYGSFKMVWLLLSISAVILGSYLVLKVENDEYGLELSRETLLLISVLSAGFQPMISNFKTGQTTPLIYLCICTMWWFYRRDEFSQGGGILVGATLIKPYFTAPLILFLRKDRMHGLSVFLIAFVIGNLLSVLLFGVDTLIAYYQTIWTFILDEGSGQNFTQLGDWSPTQLRPLYWMGDNAVYVRAVLAIPPLIFTGMFSLNELEKPVELLSLSLAAVVLILETVTAIDAAILLAVLLLLGIMLYTSASRYFFLIVGSFFLLQIHEYVMEILVGWGPGNILFINENVNRILNLLPLLQPGVYAVVIIYLISIALLINPARNALEEIRSERETNIP